MATLNETQAAATLRLTEAFKARQNREAAKVAALIALYYQQRVNVQDPASVETWLDLVIPRLIRSSDLGANDAAAFYDALRRIEVASSDGFKATPSVGTVDAGVRKSLLSVGPYSYTNKARQIENLDLPPAQTKAMLVEAKQVTTKALAASAIRHAQAGPRQTIHDNSEKDRVCLGWVRVTRPEPCFFCAMLASRGLHYRPFKEDSFAISNENFTGTGDAKVHDNCGCSLKPVYATNDPLVDRTKPFNEMWSMWGAGGGDATLRFRRGYEHWRETGDYLTWDEANAA